MHGDLSNLTDVVMLQRYELLERDPDNNGVTVPNRLIQCLRDPGELPAILTLRDPEGGEEFTVKVVKLDNLEHGTKGFAFSGRLENGNHISGTVLNKPTDDGITGKVVLSLKER